eukprot:365783-Chlamydomonas_euryale.AAC.24
MARSGVSMRPGCSATRRAGTLQTRKEHYERVGGRGLQPIQRAHGEEGLAAHPKERTTSALGEGACSTSKGRIGGTRERALRQWPIVSCDGLAHLKPFVPSLIHPAAGKARNSGSSTSMGLAQAPWLHGLWSACGAPQSR